jgi:hypothetical protein
MKECKRSEESLRAAISPESKDSLKRIARKCM